MKKLIFLLCLLSITVVYSQDKTSEDKKESTSTLDNEGSQDIQVPFNVIENVPVYSGCDENMGNQALKECMSSQISALVSKNFNTKLANSLDLPSGKHKIIVYFKIDKEGEIVEIKAKAPHSKLEEEAIRLIKLIPKMQKPGIQRGKPVIVPYGLPIAFEIEKPKPLSKKEQKRLKKNKS